MAKKYNLLIVDDEEYLRTILETELSESGEFAVDTAADGSQAINSIQRKVYDVILLDIRMPRVSGMEVLQFVHEYSPTTQVIILTNYADIKVAIQTIKMGAYDFLAKPYDIDELFNTIHRAIERKELFIDNKLMKNELTRKGASQELVGQSPAFLRMIESAERFAQSDSFVLIQGASGTGKELIAHLIHRKQQPPLRCRELRFHFRRVVGDGTVRAREGRVHACLFDEARLGRSSKRRNTFSRRSRRHQSRHTAEIAPLLRKRRVSQGRRNEPVACGCAGGQRFEQGPARRGRCRTVSRRPAVSSQCRYASCAAAA
ncbi:MAG: hypothetical protein C4326_00790 [Ignavibacteria bacterium]